MFRLFVFAGVCESELDCVFYVLINLRNESIALHDFCGLSVIIQFRRQIGIMSLLMVVSVKLQ